MKNAVYFMLKGFFVCKVFTFLSWLFGHIGKLLDKVNFKVYDIDCETNNCNTHIAQYFKKWRQSGNEISSVNGKYYEKIAFFENGAENQAGRIVADLLLFSFKIQEKQVVNTLALIYFGLDIQ